MNPSCNWIRRRKLDWIDGVMALYGVKVKFSIVIENFDLV